MSTHPPKIHTIPTELTEHILIHCARISPASLASFAQTCRAFRTLVYAPADNRLWREIFLTTFDDPRGSLEGHASGEDRVFDWGAEYRRRVWSANYLRRRTTPTAIANFFEEGKTASTPSPEPSKASSTPAAASSADLDAPLRDTVALETLLSVLHTAGTAPRTRVFSLINSTPAAITTAFNVDFDMSFAAEPAYPIFPSTRPTIQPRTSSASAASSQSHSQEGRNVPWVQSLLTRGLPPYLTREISGASWAGGLMGQFLNEREALKAQALARVLAYTGFMPVPASEWEERPEMPPVEGDAGQGAELEDAEEVRATQCAPMVGGLSMAPTAQTKRARRLARMRVYNMRYLTPARHWGPYVAVSPRNSAGVPHKPEDDELLEPILALFARPDEDADDDDTDEEDNDEDEEDAGMPTLEPVSPDSDGEDDDEDEDDERTTNPAHAGHDHGAAHVSVPGEDNAYLPHVGPPTPLPPPPPAKLCPDWTWLGAARIVVETNLREAVSSAELEGLTALEGVRADSAPVDAAVDPKESDMGRLWAGELAAMRGKGKEKAAEAGVGFEGGVEGWDWAGVTGVWRRCVCWMDYRDLILHNLSAEFNDSLTEAVRIIPMRLRAASYSPSSVPGYEHLPTIHVEGETAGASPSGIIRKMRGTVSVIADGSVRWSLTSYTVGGDGPEWISEGVQLGGMNSAMGVMGMWTGAQHERMDPLGPFWSWKVA